jgi:hypothetical protein
VAALVADQFNVEPLPIATVLGLAVSVTTGANDFTATVADCDALPPAPLHVNVKVELALKLPVDCVPRTALAPDQPPPALQAVAFMEDQVNVELPPLAIALGPTLKLTVGAGAVTETVADCIELPPAPTQVNV